MLDGVERRRLLVEPTGERPLPAAVGAPHVELDEGSGQLLELPGRGRLACPQPHDRVPDTDRLAGPQHQVADDPVAFVEKTDHRHPLGHRCHARLVGGRLGQAHVDRRRLLLLARLRNVSVAAGGEKAGEQRSYRRRSHA
jgi:hypothetical protein